MKNTNIFEPVTVYHGSNANFKTFDYSKIRTHGTSEGIGFYFTNNIEVAENYANNGYLYSVSFNGKKSLSSTKKTITKTMLKKYLKALEKHLKNSGEGFGILDNYNDVERLGVERVVNEVIELEYYSNDNDVDLIASIYNVSGCNEAVLTILYNVLGYDCIILNAEWGEQTLYIALVNDIITIENVETRQAIAV